MPNIFTWQGDLVNALVREAAMQALRDGAEHILTEAIDETPLLSGTLRRSGTAIDAPSEDAVYISFNTPYAIKQHEDLTLQHTDGGPKYLENPFNRNKDAVQRLVGDRVRNILSRG